MLIQSQSSGQIFVSSSVVTVSGLGGTTVTNGGGTTFTVSSSLVTVAGAGGTTVTNGGGTTYTISSSVPQVQAINAVGGVSVSNVGTTFTLSSSLVTLTGAGSTTVTNGGGTTYTISSSMGNWAPVSPSYVTLGNDASLTSERVLTQGTGLILSDLGAGSTVTLGINNNVVATISGSTFTGPVVANGSLPGSLQKTAAAGGIPTDTQVWISLTSAAQVANQRAGFDALLTIRSIGATGTVQCEGLGYAQAALLPTVVAAVATPTVNTTTQCFVTIACTCSVGTWTAQQATIEFVSE